MTIMGASLQLVPVILACPLRAARFAGTLYPLYLFGVTLLLLGFWVSRTTLLIAGGVLVVLAVGHYTLILGMTIASASTRPLSARYLAASSIYLCVVVSLGFTAALNFQFGFLGDAIGRLLLTHITLGIVGWLTNTLIGVSYTLVRMFALVHGHGDALGRHVFLLLNCGILGLVLGIAVRWAWLLGLGGASVTLAVWLFAYDYARMLRMRKRKPLDVTQRHGIAAVGYLVVIIPAGVVLALLGVGYPPLFAGLALAALVGWLGQSILGYLYKIVAFLIWQSRYAPLVGRARVPLMRDLIWQRAAILSFWLVNAALPIALLGALLDWQALFQIACAVLAVGLVLAAANILGVVARCPAAPSD